MFVLSISEEVLYIVCGLGLLQGILLAALIYFHPKSDRTVNTFLALYILFVSLVMLIPFAIKVLSWWNTFFLQPLPLLVGPLLYLYLQSFKKRITWRRALPHFIPFLLFVFLVYWNMNTMLNKYPDAKEVTAEIIRNPATMILIYLRLAHLIIYYFLARRTLLSYQRSIKHLFSETSHIDLQWARLLINGYLMLFMVAAIVFSLCLRYPAYFNLLLLINMAVATPYIYLITFKGVSQPSLWQGKNTVTKDELEHEIEEAEKIETHKPALEKPRSVKPGLTDNKIEAISKQIMGLMEKEKLYREAELTIQQLAGILQLPSYQVSQAINEGMNKNFYDLINGYRVEEAKRLLLNPKNSNFTVLSIGFEAGFNSKTTFNTVFKKFTGLTPTEFREKEKIETIPV